MNSAMLPERSPPPTGTADIVPWPYGTGAPAPTSLAWHRRQPVPGPELSIVVPTLNECANVGTLVERIERSLIGIDWEVIFVDDDSPDGTTTAVRTLARADRRVRCLQRIGRRGLSTACVEGILASAAPYIAVMDADLQHDERILRQMLELLRSGEADLVIGSRHVEGGSIGEFSGSRARISRIATKLARPVAGAAVSDVMSGFFMLSAPLFEQSVRNLSAIGFKILLDLLTSVPPGTRVREVPYSFGKRLAGESKLDSRAAWDYLVLLLDKSAGRYVPTRFLAFSLIGAAGVLVHMSVLAALFRTSTASFMWSQACATFVAMTFNFALNNILTYRDMRLSGLGWLRGWLTFVLACSIGAAANVGIAEYLFEQNQYWALSAIAGIVVGAVWNYAITSVYTWRAR